MKKVKNSSLLEIERDVEEVELKDQVQATIIVMTQMITQSAMIHPPILKTAIGHRMIKIIALIKVNNLQIKIHKTTIQKKDLINQIH